jgi:parallel beta-helix repeat protein
MPRRQPWFRGVSAFAFAVLAGVTYAWAQDVHQHTPSVSGMPRGIPFLCATPTVTSVNAGAWSSPRTWSTNRVPGDSDKVSIARGHRVTYDAVSDAALACIEVSGHLAFETDVNTRLEVGTIMVLEGGHLEVGSTSRPIAAAVTAEIVIANRPIDTTIDPGQVGTGLVGLGKVTMHGAVKTPTFIRLSREPRAGDTTLSFEKPVAGWKTGDRLVVPDTRQLRASGRGVSQTSQAEQPHVKALSGAQVTLAAPLQHDHKGARNTDARIEFLPHVGNISRNVIVRSENPAGTRGHTIFVSRADVDIRYVEFRELGRTRMGLLLNARFDSEGKALGIGTNEIGRYAVHFHHDFGPTATPANGHQFTLIGNSVSNTPKWGITIHRSHYGLIQDNVVFNTRGAGIVTEDGSESFNVFDHNFSVGSTGAGEFAQRTGYAGPGADPGGEGAGFWFRGPNNYVRNNVAANADQAGFGLAAGELGPVRTPAFKGADTSKASESVLLDTARAPVLEFANNEAYGAIQIGVAYGWNGTLSNVTVWHPSRHAVTGTPTDTLTVDKLTVRGDSAMLSDQLENPAGVWLNDYRSKKVIVSNANVQGMRVGVLSPFFYHQTPQGGGTSGSLLVDKGYFRTYIGVSVATAYSASGKDQTPLKSAVVRSSVFEPLDIPPLGTQPPETISMNYGTAADDPEPRDPIVVYDYNGQPGNNFKVYYSHHPPQTVAPCADTIPGIGGWVCK